MENTMNLTMLTDFYELTMANGYFANGMKDKIAVFDMFFRKVPDNGGFAIFAGLEQLIDYLKDLNIMLIDFKLEFGRCDGKIILADEISPDTCRFWDSVTKEKLDKDRFRRDLGNVEDAYKEVLKRLMGE